MKYRSNFFYLNLHYCKQGLWTEGQKLPLQQLRQRYTSRGLAYIINVIICCLSGDFSAELQLQLWLLDISSKSQRHLHILETSGWTRLKWRVYQCMPGYSVLEDAWWTGLKSFRGRRGLWEFGQLQDVSVLYDVFLKNEERLTHVVLSLQRLRARKRLLCKI